MPTLSLVSEQRIDASLTVRAGHLWLEECDLVEIAQRFGTPLYVISEDQLLRNLESIGAAFRAEWPHGEVRVLPSIKANLSLAVRRVLTRAGAGCDTFGPGELHAALAARVPPQPHLGQRLGQERRGDRAGGGSGRADHAGQCRGARAHRGRRCPATGSARRSGCALRPDYDGLDRALRLLSRRRRAARRPPLQAGHPHRAGASRPARWRSRRRTWS